MNMFQGLNGLQAGDHWRKQLTCVQHAGWMHVDCQVMPCSGLYLAALQNSQRAHRREHLGHAQHALERASVLLSLHGCSLLLCWRQTAAAGGPLAARRCKARTPVGRGSSQTNKMAPMFYAHVNARAWLQARSAAAERCRVSLRTGFLLPECGRARLIRESSTGLQCYVSGTSVRPSGRTRGPKQVDWMWMWM